MAHYNLRSTSLTGSKLDAELRNYGAHTSGTQARKQERLQRFMNADEKHQAAVVNLRVVIQNEQRKVYDRMQTRAAAYARGF